MKTYIAYGNVRGGCRHKHKTFRGAKACADQDRAAVRSLGGGAYSDRQVHAHDCMAVRGHGKCDCGCGCE